MKIKNDFPKILEDYFKKHLTKERRFSDNTYSTYLNVIKQFINYLTTNKVVRGDIDFTSFNKANILNFLSYIEESKGISPRTRNHKLTIINSFLEYAQSVNPIYMNTYMEVKSIKFKKTTKKKMDFLTVTELKSIFQAIDLKYKSGYKHYVTLSILYDTGARVSELINIKVDDCFFDSQNPYIKILGKGSKERVIFVNDDLVKMIEEYKRKLNIKEGYLLRNNSNNKFTRDGINKLITKYWNIAKTKCKTLEHKNVSPHTFRHSKAVHFLENNTALPIIQRFLGHSSITTTEIYLDITNEVVSNAVKKAASVIDIQSEEASWEKDDKLLSLLESL